MQCRLVDPVKILEHDQRRSFVIDEDVDERRQRARSTNLGVDRTPVVTHAILDGESPAGLPHPEANWSQSVRDVNRASPHR